MALNYYFFDAQLVDGEYDRKYSSGDFSKYLKGIVGSGVFPIPSNSLQVYSSSGMNVMVRPGMGWIDGHKLENDADLSLAIDASDITLNRIDRVVMRLDVNNRLMDIYIKKGTNASQPVAPTLERTDYIKEYSLAEITVNKQITEINESMIRDTRLDSSVCGMVQGLIQQVSTETLYKQWNDAYDRAMAEDQKSFDEWFADVKENLSTVIMWQELKRVIKTESTNVKTIDIGISNYNYGIDILNVYVNGMRLDSDEYTFNDTTITFTEALDVVGTTIEIVVYKAVSGEGAETVVAQVSQINQDILDINQDILDVKNEIKSIDNKPNIFKKNISIPTSAWSLVNGYYQADISDASIDENCMVNVNFALSSISVAQDAEVQSVTTTKNGACTLYAKKVPSSALTCDYIILRGEVK